jgi:pSer/pThr/pTyr-binding forkhead associated (FHA) protein
MISSYLCKESFQIDFDALNAGRTRSWAHGHSTGGGERLTTADLGSGVSTAPAGTRRSSSDSGVVTPFDPGAHVVSLDLLEAFRDACGAAGPLLLDVTAEDDREGRRRSFFSPFLIVGRHENADLVLDHPEVSRRHVYLQVVAGRLSYIDFESRTGTLVEGSNEWSGWIDHSSAVRIGPFTFRVCGSDRDSDVVATGVAGPGPLSGRFARGRDLPDAILEISGRTGKPIVWRIDRVMVLIGRSPLCTLRLPEPDASRFACSLLRTTTGVWLVDLLSSAGVFVNGERRRLALLADGDEVRVGDYAVRLRSSTADHRSRSGRREQPAFGTMERVDPVAGRSGVSPEQIPRTMIQDHPRRTSPGSALMEVTPGDDRPIPAMLSLMKQTEQIQQQMSDHYEQTIQVMSQMIETLQHQYHDEMVSVREEIDQLLRITGTTPSADAKSGPLATPEESSVMGSANPWKNPIIAQ